MSKSSSDLSDSDVVEESKGVVSEEFLSQWLGRPERELLNQDHLTKAIVKIKKLQGFFEFFVVAPEKSWSSRFFHHMTTKAIVPYQQLDPRVYTAISARVGACKDRVMVGYCRIFIPQQYEWMERESHLLLGQIEKGLVSEKAAMGTMEESWAALEDKNGLISLKIDHYASFFFKEERKRFQWLAAQVLNEMGQLWIRQMPVKVVVRILLAMGAFTREMQKSTLQLRQIAFHRQTPLGPKKMIAAVIAFRLESDFHCFKLDHFITQLYSLLPDIAVDQRGFLRVPGQHWRDVLLYGEIDPSYYDLDLIQKAITDAVHGTIYSLVHPLFVERNEEEMLRYTVLLADQVRTKKDLPHLAILFNRYDQKQIMFSAVVVAMIAKNANQEDPEEKLAHIPQLVLEKRKSLSLQKKGLAKEFFLIQGTFSSSEYVREDFSLDFFGARQGFVEKLVMLFGPMRDYNGAVMQQEREICEIMCEDKTGEQKLFFEKAFFAVKPAQARVVYVKEVKKLIELGYEIFSKKRKHSLFIDKQKHFSVYLGVGARDEDLAQKETLLTFSFQWKEELICGQIHYES